MRKRTQTKKNMVGRQVRQVRMTRHERMTQADLAAKCQLIGLNMTREAIAKIECGTRKVSDIEVKHLADILEVSVERLFRV